jgi:hypothetical protein
VLDRVNARHDRVDAGDGGVEPSAGPHIAGDVFDVGVLVPPSAAENAHVDTLGQQAVHHGAAHRAGPAGDKNSGRHNPYEPGRPTGCDICFPRYRSLSGFAMIRTASTLSPVMSKNSTPASVGPT